MQQISLGNLFIMIIATSPFHLNIENVYFCKPIKNKIMSGGNFIRIIYSDHIVSINGIHLSFLLTGKIQDVYNNKYKFTYSGSEDNKDIIKMIIQLEEDLLKSVITDPKITPSYKLKDQINQGNFKFFQNQPGKCPSDKNVQDAIFVLKISGVWSNENSYGITYKFTRVKPMI
tara:strand:- start:5338 stop:5856 length:519 start_codon:yes stop_codon:yes gene_type:complete